MSVSAENKIKLEQKRKSEIISAAKVLFYTYGFSGTNVDAIAKRAKISKGLIYHYFKSKVDILLSFSSEIKVYLENLENEENPKDALIKFGEDFLVNDVEEYENAVPIQILLTTFANGEVDTSKYENHNPILCDVGREYLGKLFQRGIDLGIFKDGDAREYGDIYWSFLLGKLLPVKKGNEKSNPEIYVKEIISMFYQDTEDGIWTRKPV